MNNYLDLIKIYYNEKHIFLTSDKNCNGCIDNKKFTEYPAEIIFNCGGTPESKCGDKIRITLPIYLTDSDLNYYKRHEPTKTYLNYQTEGFYFYNSLEKKSLNFYKLDTQLFLS